MPLVSFLFSWSTSRPGGVLSLWNLRVNLRRKRVGGLAILSLQAVNHFFSNTKTGVYSKGNLEIRCFSKRYLLVFPLRYNLRH